MEDKEKIQDMTDEFIQNIGLLVIEVTNKKRTPLEFLEELEKNRESYYKKIEELKNKDEAEI